MAINALLSVSSPHSFLGINAEGQCAIIERRILGSEALQSDFFEFHMRAFARDPQLRAATVFQLFDWSPELSGMYQEAFDAAGEPIIGEKLQEWLATVGLCRWSDATCRPAWDTFLAGLNDLQAARGK